jgi:hypothetical protein
MKRILKVSVIVLAAGYLTLIMAADKQTSRYDAKSDSGKKNYLMALRSGNKGLAESSLMFLSKLKITAPGSDMNAVRPIVDSLMQNGSSPSIRYKAYLTTSVIDDPLMYTSFDIRDVNAPDEFFGSIAQHLNTLAVRKNFK